MAQIRKHGGNLKEASEIYNYSEEDFLDFSANINPLGPPPEVYAVIRDNLEKLTRYPDSRNVELRKALAKHLNISEKNILMGNGASELIFLIVNHLKPSNVWIPVPTFSEYEIASTSIGSRIVQLSLQGEDFSELNVDKLKEMQKGDLIFLCNPNNPTGQLYSPQLLKQICEITEEKGAYLVIDESFLDFIENNQELTFMGIAMERAHLIVLYSLTKFFAIPGLRLGAMISNTEIIKQFDQIRDPWNINIFAQLAGQVALENKEYINKTLQFFQKERDFLYNKLRQFNGIIPLKPSANYIFIRLLEPYTSTTICETLASQGILLRNCNSYPLLGERYIRLAIKSRENNVQLLEKLKKIIN